MKAKTYRFIFSALLICFAAVGKAQTIDGKLYTPFNNYYQWIGGKFNNNLNIPKIAATNGRDTGGIRYSLIDSSMYVWTGSQWRAVGSSLDTSSLSNRIEARVKYADTAAMLSNYINSASNGLTKSGQNIKLGGTLTESTIISGNNNAFSVNGRSDGMRGQMLVNGELALLASYNNFGSGASVQVDSTQISMVSSRSINPNHFLRLRSDSLVLESNGSIPYSQKAATNTDNQFLVLDTINNTVKRFTGTIQSDTATVVKAYVTNAEAVTITKGQVVYIFGAQGDRASVKLAKNTSDTFSSKTLGIVRADIAAGQAGWVTTQGQVSGINLGAYSPGDILWLDSVPGGFTKVKPVAPYHSVFVGVVERANAGNGLIYVKPQNGVELDELHNVKITSPRSGDAITYTPASQIWENRQVVLKQDTIPLAVFNVGSAAAGDTAAFSTSTLAGSFYLDGTDTMFVTSYRVALQGTSASITPEVWFNDSLNVTAGGTRLATGSAITNLTTGTSVTPTTNKIPPGNFVFVRFSAVTTKPTYFTLTLFGYRIRKQ